VLKLAVVTPPEVVTLTGPPALLLSMTNCTVPLGEPPPGGVTLTVAVKVTVCPGVDGLADERTVVLVLALLTVSMVVPLLPVKLPSPV
jgi:hypothetical protein